MLVCGLQGYADLIGIRQWFVAKVGLVSLWF